MKALSNDCFNIVDERAKVPFNQKKELAKAGAFGKIYYITKDIADGLISVIER